MFVAEAGLVSKGHKPIRLIKPFALGLSKGEPVQMKPFHGSTGLP
jgi:hypothetical protein